jgi:hypothetical protein
MAEPQITYRVAAHLSSKGDLAKSMGQKAAAIGGLSAKLDMASSRAMAFGRAQTQAMVGAASAIGKYSAAIGGMAVAGGLGMMVAKGAELNAGMEKATNTIAGTLQLFNHSAGAADQLGQNIKIAGAAMQMLNKIADDSPGEMRDVQTLFQNMLPGARSVTGEMGRIMNLTKSLAVFTPTLGGDFGLVGAQMSRMLTGGAGAEMEVWRTLQVPILKAGQAMEQTGKKGKMIFAANQQEGEKLTQAFNKLSKEDRLRVVESAMKGGADDLAKMYAKSWEGASASAISSLRKIAGSVHQAHVRGDQERPHQGQRRRRGPRKGRPAEAAHCSGERFGGLLAKGLVKVIGGIEQGATYLSNNWESVANTVYPRDADRSRPAERRLRLGPDEDDRWGRDHRCCVRRQDRDRGRQGHQRRHGCGQVSGEGGRQLRRQHQKVRRHGDEGQPDQQRARGSDRPDPRASRRSPCSPPSWSHCCSWRVLRLR